MSTREDGAAAQGDGDGREPAGSVPTTTGPAGADARPDRWRWAVPAVGILIVAALVGGFAVGRLAGEIARPAGTSAAAGFARDMQVHHAQAVQMAMVVRDRTTDADVRLLAYDIALSQQHQIGQMYAWLTLWDLPQTTSAPPMAWMSAPDGEHEGSAHASSGTTPQATEVAMPGMASPEQLRRLELLSGPAAEVLFLELMIAHHRGGVHMAEAVLERSAPAEVHRLASTIVSAQTSEIEAMQAMLGERTAQA